MFLDLYLSILFLFFDPPEWFRYLEIWPSFPTLWKPEVIHAGCVRRIRYTTKEASVCSEIATLREPKTICGKNHSFEGSSQFHRFNWNSHSLIGQSRMLDIINHFVSWWTRMTLSPLSYIVVKPKTVKLYMLVFR